MCVQAFGDLTSATMAKLLGQDDYEVRHTHPHKHTYAACSHLQLTLVSLSFFPSQFGDLSKATLRAIRGWGDNLNSKE